MINKSITKNEGIFFMKKKKQKNKDSIIKMRIIYYHCSTLFFAVYLKSVEILYGPAGCTIPDLPDGCSEYSEYSIRYGCIQNHNLIITANEEILMCGGSQNQKCYRYDKQSQL